jgi:hypothetical protein
LVYILNDYFHLAYNQKELNTIPSKYKRVTIITVRDKSSTIIPSTAIIKYSRSDLIKDRCDFNKLGRNKRSMTTPISRNSDTPSMESFSPEL